MVVTLIYFRPLGIIYLFIGPGLIVATVWLGVCVYARMVGEWIICGCVGC